MAEALSNHRNNHKNQVLQDMGLSVWVDRSAYLAERQSSDQSPADGAGEVPAPAQPHPNKLDSTASSTSAPATGLAALNELLGTDSPNPAAVASGTSAQRRPTVAASAVGALATPSVADFVCYWGGGVLLLTDLVPFTGRDRLIKDVLAAASGDWQQRLGQAAFRWEEVAPAQDVDQTPATEQVLERSLVAFVSKRLAAAKAHSVLTCGAVDSLVVTATEQALANLKLKSTSTEAESSPNHLSITPLAELAGDARAKVALWQQLVALRG